jgi:hypothetical protein
MMQKASTFQWHAQLQSKASSTAVEPVHLRNLVTFCSVLMG